MSNHDYIRDGDAIYQRSFAIIRAETDLSRFSEDEADIVVRMVHACGSPEVAATSCSATASPPWRGSRWPLARRSSAIPRWSRMASRARGSPQATT
jgi:hypothetical protein